MTSANEKFLSLKRTITELIRDGTVESEFSFANHLQAVKEERSEGKNPGMTSAVPNKRQLLRTYPTLIVDYFSVPNK